MKTAHPLQGIIRFMGRDSWRDDLDDVVEAHFGAVLDTLDLAFEALGDVLGDHWPAILWTCALEDALSQEFEGGRNPVDDYLKRRGWKETAANRAYLKALRSSRMSLYEVSAIVPGQSFLARDLLRDGEPVLVHEATATMTLRPWETIATRVLDIGGRHTLTGGLLPFSPEAVALLRDGIQDLEGTPRNASAAIRLDDDTLRKAAPIVTLAWLMDTLTSLADPALPDIRNRDGDPFLLHDIRFPLATGATPDDIALPLSAIAAFQPLGPHSWNWIEAKPDTSPPVTGEPRAMAFDVTLEDGTAVLGRLGFRDAALVLSTTSAPRAEKGIALLYEVLGSRIGPPEVETTTAEEIMASRPDVPGPHHPDLPPGVETRLVHDSLDRQYRALLDRPVGMLDDAAPRDAVHTEDGRDKVAAWLKHLEFRSARPDDPDNPMASYDFTWIWRELGILDLRR